MAEAVTVEDLKKILIESCPDLGNEEAVAAAEELRAKGLTSRSRLLKVQEKHLIDAGLSEFQALDVLEKLKENHRKNGQEQAGPETEPIEGAKLITFRLNWKSIYARSRDLENRLKKGMRLTPAERRKIVEEVSTQIENKLPNCPRSLYKEVYMDQMLVKHRQSFEETLGAHGSHKKTVSGILKQLLTRHDNFRGPDRNKPLTTKEKETPNIKAAVGTIRWRVLDCLEGETEESLEEKKEELKNIYETVRENHFDWEKITSSMTVTYKLQRDLINKNMEGAIEQQKAAKKKKMKKNKRTQDKENEGEIEGNQQEENEMSEIELDENSKVKMEDIKKEFPFLFTTKGMMVHFSLLTGIEVLATLEEFLAKEVDPFLTYFDSTDDNHFLSLGRKMKRAIDNGEDRGPEYIAYVKLVTLLKMVLHEFKEDEYQLWARVEEGTALEEVDETELPATPILIGVGRSILNPEKFYFAVDRVLLNNLPVNISAVAMLYMAYCTFNLNYPGPAQVTLEFMQRVVFKHVTERGHKRPSTRKEGGNFNTSVHHLSITSFLQKVNDHLGARNNDTSDGEEI